MSTMRAMGWSRTGSGEAPKLFHIDLPEPGAGQVKVKVVCSALNPADRKVAAGELAGRFLHARVSPLILGYDFSGVIDSGPGMADLEIGDEVFGFLPYSPGTRQGAFAEFVVVDRGAIGRKPKDISHETAAAAATPGLTALQFLRDLGQLKAGGKVLIIGASGGVGSLAIGIAKRLGGHATALCSAHAIDYVRGLGADVVADRSKQDPLAIDGPFDVVFDLTAAYSYLAFRSRIGARGAFVSTLPSLSIFIGKAVAALSGQRCAFGSVRPTSSDLEQLARWLGGGLRVPISARFQVNDLGSALATLAKGGVHGRIAMQVEGGFES